MFARFVRACCVVLALGCAAGFSPRASAALLSSFQTAFQLNTPAAGWSYLWNKNGAIGTPANYAALLATPTGQYTSDGTNTFPSAAPGRFIVFGMVDGAPGGHPGTGITDGGSGGIDHFAISAYTVPVSDTIAITNSLVRNQNPNGGGSENGVNVQVFVNNNSTPLVNVSTAPGFGTTTQFNKDLGALNAGDVIYVAVGAGQNDLRDSFKLEYDLVTVTVPEPCGVVLVGIVACVAGVVRRRRRR